ncbi:MAG TPA: alpha/beta fold hydrolase [Thermoanaerobaculia bacterium]
MLDRCFALPLLLCAGLFLLAGRLPAAPAGEPATGFVEVPGGKLWYEVRGQGAPLVLLHDGLLPSETWDDQVPAFSRAFRTIRYDRRGYGRSEASKEPFSDVDDLAAVLAALKVDRAVLVGCSNGGKLAVDFALAYPDRVESLVLVGPVVSGLPYSTHMLRRSMSIFRPVFREKDVAAAIEGWVRDPYLVDAANTRTKERLRELLTRYPGPMTRTGSESKEPERPAAGRLSEIRKPALIVVGASDIPDVHAHSGALAAGIDHARREVLPGAGHLIHMEIPERFNETVLGFLRPGDAAAAYLESLKGDRTFEEGRRLFDYDASAPLDVREAGTETRGGARVVDLSYASPLGGRVPAFLVLPGQAEGRRPAVLFLHHGQGNRSTFLDEAVMLAGHGVVSLLIEAPFLRPEYQDQPRTPWDPQRDRKEQIQGVVDLRRGLDLLAARPEVDASRMAYIGHSLGATLGGTLAGIERRPVAYVLMAGLPANARSWSQAENLYGVAFRSLLTAEQQEAYVKALAPIDAVHYVGRAAPAKLLLQFARHDELISPWDAEVYIQAASEPKEVQWYDTDHFFIGNEEARKRRMEWVLKAFTPSA